MTWAAVHTRTDADKLATWEQWAGAAGWAGAAAVALAGLIRQKVGQALVRVKVGSMSCSNRWVAVETTQHLNMLHHSNK